MLHRSLCSRLFFLLSFAGLTARLVAATPTHEVFGRAADGTTIDAYTLTNAHGAKATIITYGAILADLQIPDRDGKLVPVVRPATFSEVSYKRGFPQAAMVAGRVANRIANASFTLDGHDYKLAANNGAHTLHGGLKGFGKVLWSAQPIESSAGSAVRLTYTSVDGEEGFPGQLTATITYTLTDANVLRLDYTATTDKPTIINLTNHAYFNLAGGGDVTDYTLTLDADRTTASDATLIPTGEIVSVKGTPLDFTTPTALGARVDQLGKSNRYDHNFVINRTGPGLVRAAHITDPKSGRTLELWTTEPGVQLYTSPLDAATAKDRVGFFCLESQHFPDSIHHENFPTTVLRPGETFSSTTEFRFR
jgi:aldose 1-epimerase